MAAEILPPHASADGLTQELLPLYTAVLSCERCPPTCVLRDAGINVPQPGWVGRRYRPGRGVMFIGQNPGVRKAATAWADEPYIEALRAVTDSASLDRLLDVMARSLPVFHLYRHYIPLEHIEDVAIINMVRCRTPGDGRVPDAAVANCGDHLRQWLAGLRPRAVVFNGVWASRAAHQAVAELGVPTETINRLRSLPTEARQAQRARVLALLEAT